MMLAFPAKPETILKSLSQLDSMGDVANWSLARISLGAAEWMDLLTPLSPRSLPPKPFSELESRRGCILLRDPGIVRGSFLLTVGSQTHTTQHPA